jgi:hypothetical protein
LAIDALILSSSRPNSSGRGADALVELVHRRVLHEFHRRSADLTLLDEHFRVDRVPPHVRRHDDQSTDALRELDGRPERGGATERIAQKVRSIEVEVLDQAGDVIGHEPRVDRSVDVGRPAVSLQVGHDELVALGQGRQDRPERLSRSEAAVQQDQRSTAAMDLVVHMQAVDVGVVADDLGITAQVGRGHLATPFMPRSPGRPRTAPRIVPRQGRPRVASPSVRRRRRLCGPPWQPNGN